MEVMCGVSVAGGVEEGEGADEGEEGVEVEVTRTDIAYLIGTSDINIDKRTQLSL